MPEKMDYALELNHVVKKYGFQTPVKGVDLHVPKQSVYCLVGPDQAAKSMVLQLAAGLSTPTEGDVIISGMKERKDHHTSTGLYLKGSDLVPEWTIYRNFLHLAIEQRLKDRHAQIKEIMNLFGLKGHSIESVGSLPNNVRSMAGIALAFLGWPDVILLEEPFEYLYPDEIRKVASIFNQLKIEKNLSIVLSSSKVNELDDVADCYGVFINGRLEEEILPEDTHKFSTKQIHLRVGSVKKALRLFSEYDCETRDDNWIIINDANLPAKMIFETLMKNKIDVYEIYNHTLDKNEYFKRYKL